MNRSLKPLLALLLMLFVCLPTFSEGNTPEEIGEQLTIKLVTFGQGDPVYIWYGHIALIVEDASRGTSYMFDYGIFDFEQEAFYRNFALGRLYYLSAASRTEPRISYAIETERNIKVSTLSLSPAKRYELYSLLLDDIRPENATYLYHHYYNNCSTKIRDVIDTVLDGQLQMNTASIRSDYTYREHIRRYSGHHYLIDLMLNSLQSGVIDRPISLYDEMFLPDRLHTLLEDFSYTDEQGTKRPLLVDTRILASFDSRPPIPETPATWWPAALAVGILLASGFGLARYHAATSRFAKRAYRVSSSLLGLLLGTAGLLLGFMMFFTDHDVTYGNVNLLIISPILLGILPLVLKRGRPTSVWADRIWGLLWLLSIPLLFLQFCSIVTQQNQYTEALLLPFSWSHTIAVLLERYRTKRHEKVEGAVDE